MRLHGRDPIDISEPMKALAGALELDYRNVSELRIKPDEVEAIVFLENDRGKKVVDSASGHVVMTTRKIPVRT